MPTSKKPSKLPIILIIVCFISVIFAFRHVLKGLRPSKTTPVQNVPIPTATPTPILLPHKTFIDQKESFGFNFPASWSAQPSKTDKNTTITTFIACGETALILNQIKNPTFTLQEYLGLAVEALESKIDGRNSILLSNETESVIAIADQDKQEFIVLSYIPTCQQLMDEGKQKEFLPLLQSFTFY